MSWIRSSGNLSWTEKFTPGKPDFYMTIPSDTPTENPTNVPSLTLRMEFSMSICSVITTNSIVRPPSPIPFENNGLLFHWQSIKPRRNSKNNTDSDFSTDTGTLCNQKRRFAFLVVLHCNLVPGFQGDRDIFDCGFRVADCGLFGVLGPEDGETVRLGDKGICDCGLSANRRTVFGFIWCIDFEFRFLARNPLSHRACRSVFPCFQCFL